MGDGAGLRQFVLQNANFPPDQNTLDCKSENQSPRQCVKALLGIKHGARMPYQLATSSNVLRLAIAVAKHVAESVLGQES